MMKIAIIVAMDENRGIGINNRLPWRIAADLKRFKQLTMGHHLVIGRKTYQSIGKALPGRKMLILSRNSLFQAPGCRVVTSLEEAIQTAHNGGETELWIAGGAEIYRLALPLADELYLTRVHAHTPADTFFPHLDESAWKEVTSQFIEADAHNEYAATFSILQANRKSP